MIKKLCCLILMFSAISAYSPLANAVDLSLGATAWYVKWDTPEKWNLNSDPTFLYGPVMSINFNEDFGFTFVFLYGKFKSDTTDYSENMNTRHEDKIKRYDSDAAFNYTLNSYFKIFAGIKYLKYDEEAKFNSYLYPSSGTITDEHTGFGPAGGISGVFPLGYDFYILANFSVMYLRGVHNGDGIDSKDYNEYGINTSAALAYYITAASVTVSLGGRFQGYTTKYENTFPEEKHKFYGATLTATYSFNI